MTFKVAVYHLRRKAGKILLTHCMKKARSGCLLVSSQGCFQIRQSSMVMFSESKRLHILERWHTLEGSGFYQKTLSYLGKYSVSYGDPPQWGMAYRVLMIMVTVMVERTMLTVSALVLCAKNYAGHFPFSGPVNLMKSQPNTVSTIFPIL